MRVGSPTREEGREVAPGISILPKPSRKPRPVPPQNGEGAVLPSEPGDGANGNGQAAAGAEVGAEAETAAKRPRVRRVQEVDTPARTLFEILHETGWSEKKSDFSRVLDVRQKNAYMYLDEGPSRIKASAETIFAWIRMIQRHTRLLVEVTLLGDGRIRFFYHGITGPVVPGLAKDLKVPPTERYALEPAWMDDARQARAVARRQAHAPKKRKAR